VCWKHNRPIIVTVMYTCSFITHLDLTRKWTACHPVWLEFLNFFFSLSFKEVLFLLVSPLFVSLTASLLPFLKEAIKATRSPCCLRTCVPRSTKLGGHQQFIRFGRFLRTLVWVLCHWVKIVLYFLQSVIATEWARDIFKWNRH
jgi:hypothetical protein